MIRAFDRAPRSTPAPAATSRAARSDEEGALLCAACGAAISHQAARIEVGGAHSHRFTNPAGFTYDVVCLREAAGCYVQGPSTGDFTWFPGYAWSYALCGTCHQHLGWFYEGPAKFFGLIAERLVTDSGA